MCNPMMFAMMQVAGAVQQGQAANNAAQSDAMYAEASARESRQDAQGVAARVRREGATARGSTLAAVAASGVKVGEGSALEAERQVMEDYSRDEYMAILSGERRASGLQMEAGNRRRAGRDARRAGYINAGTSLMASGAQGLKDSGWRRYGPGFSGGQAPAPVETRVPVRVRG